jgi:tRNA pseudouridine55 synthase
MVVCLGRATKLTQFISDYDKVYEAEICLGQKSRTFDSEGIYHDQMPMKIPEMTDQEAQHLLDQYKGIITQQVPAYSAVRVDGRRLYDMAREGIEVDPPTREVEIKEMKLTSYHIPHLRFTTICSKGTYIRSLADDMGNKLGCGAYLSKLRRIRVGPLTLDKAMTMDEVMRANTTGTLERYLLDYHEVLTFSAVRVSDDFKKYVVSGRELTPPDILAIEGTFSKGDRIMLRDIRGKVLAVGTAEADVASFSGESSGQKLFSYIRVLN